MQDVGTYMLWTFGIFYEYFILYQEKSATLELSVLKSILPFMFTT
jgi:hypothetical protein